MKTYPLYASTWRLPGGSIHGFVPPPPPLPPAVFPCPGPSCAHLELPHTLRWVLDGKFTSNVKFDGQLVAKDGHDTGTNILHIGIPPSAGMAITILFSKYKIVFGASAVKVNGGAIGTWYPVLAPPMFCSNPCAMPAVAPFQNDLVPYFATVRVGMSEADLLSGWGAVAFEMAVDLFFNFLFAGFGFKAGKEAIKKMIEAEAEELFKDALKTLGKALWQKFYRDFFKKVVQGVLRFLHGSKTKGLRIELPVLGWGIQYDLVTKKWYLGPPGDPKKVCLDDLQADDRLEVRNEILDLEGAPAAL
jgi:hypothetical protein